MVWRSALTYGTEHFPKILVPVVIAAKREGVDVLLPGTLCNEARNIRGFFDSKALGMTQKGRLLELKRFQLLYAQGTRVTYMGHCYKVVYVYPFLRKENASLDPIHRYKLYVVSAFYGGSGRPLRVAEVT
jgi:hypothetical protein